MFIYFVSIIYLINIVYGLSSAYDIGYDDHDNSYSMGPNKVNAAINTKLQVKTVPVHSSKYGGGGGGSTVVDINGNGGGNLILRFNGGGSNIQTIQKGIQSGNGKIQKQSIMAEPDILVQNVQKPIIQKIRMQIQPIRQITQEIRPVEEKIETVIAKDMVIILMLTIISKQNLHILPIQNLHTTNKSNN
ncbi:hypothetical protein DERP_001533 [Dermatophagoides pteronyssinus]|uniref:Uncharacterized protein n=1 Tax=Dermatophagoides pteronyssinus TaxID=6956 RepID=A0ABQ8JBE5_DERPT|nr:hypothetical protein DERP_001533 [Dermatophagoides pteronyssinus]